MIAWRISKAKRADDLSGMGAALEGGRWNDIDVPAVYMGLSAAICCLETFVHAAGNPAIPLKITRYALPDDPALYWEPTPQDLPVGWPDVPADRASIDFSTAWLRQGLQLGMIVPSAVLPLERNIVINPRHPAIAQVLAEQRYDFLYDERMFASRDR